MPSSDLAGQVKLNSLLLAIGAISLWVLQEYNLGIINYAFSTVFIGAIFILSLSLPFMLIEAWNKLRGR